MDSWNDKAEQMKRWIDENLEDTPRLSELAQRLGYSYFYAARRFREAEGTSFREYISNRKVQSAAADLYQTKERMLDIAVKYGYSSQEAFTRAFARVYGITPGVYRRLHKTTSTAEKSRLLGSTKPNGGEDMKIYARQMHDWNCYAFYAEDVEEKYHDYFISELWWQAGNTFIRQFDNVKDFEYCAENFTKYGEHAIKQQLKILPCPWRSALDKFMPMMNELGIDWYIHGSVAMALWGISVEPRNVDVIVANYSDFDKMRERFYKLANRQPIERCDDWVMSGGGEIFLDASIGIWVHNKELEPFDMSQLERMDYNGEQVYISSLELLKRDNEYYGRPDRVRLIEERMGAR